MQFLRFQLSFEITYFPQKINLNFQCRENKSYNYRQLFLQPYFLIDNNAKIPYGPWEPGTPDLPARPRKKQKFLSLLQQV